ncbi:MAG: formate dehydrogenase accessory sulfurtransferase FdhD [Saccharopolyspora sp.]|uniref:formate dehydrogenase accessory sulfurtransferase FdhD n=1 Tax=Saccharopolyspora TaxID=1835 RepID=UPI00190CB179|nr:MULTISPECIES: formate dehydrogenase accessory sulfurtransferase FdhD [unclassified Saccharopolyspora]MBK0868193.1 formate dehydrogenase accessory sulfurtransferase FdhD [Saccharopolyspora sp. HNM0986]MBQ6639802.1 formate dehydrogenase accessory sulfurtransferase FdhD [Saccharopolyspora sp.]
MGRVTVRRPVLRITEQGARTRPDTLAAEEPLEIRIDGRALTVTMRTPGNDVELAHGFLLTESVIGGMDDVHSARYCDSPGPDGRNTYNVLDVRLSPGVSPPDTSVERNFYTTSSCGVCGKAALDSVRLSTRYSPAEDPLRISPETLAELPERLRAAQQVFDSTGGLHGAALFDAHGELLVCREDVGRHNAVDKVLGWALLQRRVPLGASVLMVSGRASFELVQKAAMAGVPMLTAVSAPSSLAVELAAEQGMTLVGFLRGSSMNVYTGAERVTAPEPAAVR